MQPIRILLMAIPRTLAEVVRQAVAEQTDVVVVGEVTGGMDLLLAAGLTGADLVILGLEDSQLPGVCSHLVGEYPHIKVLGLTQKAFLYESRPQAVASGGVSSQELRNMIRSAFSSELRAGGAVNH